LVEKILEKTPYLTGNDFTVADAYLYVVLSWTPRLDIDLTPFPRIQDFFRRVDARPSVVAAKQGEGL
jgi:glutathione S-transferase